MKMKVSIKDTELLERLGNDDDIGEATFNTTLNNLLDGGRLSLVQLSMLLANHLCKLCRKLSHAKRWLHSRRHNHLRLTLASKVRGELIDKLILKDLTQVSEEERYKIQKDKR